MSKKLYHERDVETLDDAGGFYFRHVMAMTSEQLHSKSDIAAELGFRDMIIDELESKLLALQADRDALRQVCAEAYQMAGAIDAPNEALDNLSAAANGDPIPHKTFLPIFGDHLAAHDAEVLDRMVVAVGEAFAYPNTLNPKTKSAEYYKSGWRNAFIFCKQYAAQLRTKK